MPQPRDSHAVEYDLGETTIIQDRFPEDSRFRHMPVRLNGMIAVPDGDGPFPVVVILHGTHPGCPEVEHGVDRWPCDPADERLNYQGFGYLTERLAAEDYVALTININAENTFGFGEPTPGERLNQIIDKHLRALATAAAGGENKFGVDLEEKADMHRLALAGHSRGGEMAFMFNNSPEMTAARKVMAAVDPLSKLNAMDKPQGFSIRLTDGSGKSSTVPTRPQEPALRFPQGEIEYDEMFGDMFSGRLPLNIIRAPIPTLPGVDMTDIREIALVFDQTPSGSLFLADLELALGGE